MKTEGDVQAFGGGDRLKNDEGIKKKPNELPLSIRLAPWRNPLISSVAIWRLCSGLTSDRASRGLALSVLIHCLLPGTHPLAALTHVLVPELPGGAMATAFLQEGFCPTTSCSGAAPLTAPSVVHPSSLSVPHHTFLFLALITHHYIIYLCIYWFILCPLACSRPLWEWGLYLAPCASLGLAEISGKQ